MNTEQSSVKRRILLIEDDSFFIGLLSFVLTKSNYEIIVSNNGKDAIAILSEQTVDMIILDLMMPEMDGLAFLQWLREEVIADTPVIVLTGMVAADTEQQVMAAGATALLYKPVKTPDLLAKILEIEQLAISLNCCGTVPLSHFPPRKLIKLSYSCRLGGNDSGVFFQFTLRLGVIGFGRAWPI